MNLILYGSQHGYGTSIAEFLHKTLNINRSWELYQMNHYLKTQDLYFSNYQYVIIIISTTGNGDPPDNARKFCRLLKKFEPTDYMIKYCVLALGDTNYDHYCKPGIFVDKQFGSIGAERFMDLTTVDDGTQGKELEPWLEKIKEFFNQDNMILVDKMALIDKTDHHNDILPSDKIIAQQTSQCCNVVKIIDKKIDKFNDSSSIIVTMDMMIINDMVWHPGQSIVIMIDNIPRYYSIASSPMQPEKYKKITIIFSVTGKCTNWLYNLPLESEFNIGLSEPNDFIYLDKSNPVVCISMGTGIAPILGILLHLAYGNQQYDNFSQKLDIYHGCKNEESIVGKSFLDKISKMLKINIHYAFSNKKQYVQSIVSIDTNATVYCCGKYEMIKSIIETYDNKIIFEDWNQ